MIAWLRVREFQLLSLRMICHQMLRASPHYSALEAGHAPVDLEAESPMSRYDKAKDKVVLPRPLPPPPPHPTPAPAPNPNPNPNPNPTLTLTLTLTSPRTSRRSST